ncbi:MAG TPA: hypothetical protein VGH90_09460 [Chthoniobacteraceae bacterium]|jgi:hypothetical protein
MSPALRRVILPFLPALLPLAVAWVRAREGLAIRHGIALDATQLDDARAIGVREPERVRLLGVEAIPTFQSRLLAPLAWLTRDVFQQTAGITVQYGILIRADCWGSRPLIIHELTHVAQYERLGGIRPFLAAYLKECLIEGYPNGELEQEAIVTTARFMV